MAAAMGPEIVKLVENCSIAKNANVNLIRNPNANSFRHFSYFPAFVQRNYPLKYTLSKSEQVDMASSSSSSQVLIRAKIQSIGGNEM